MEHRNIGFLGAGNMAGAMVKALLNAGVVSPERILASDVREDRLDDFMKSSNQRLNELQRGRNVRRRGGRK